VIVIEQVCKQTTEGTLVSATPTPEAAAPSVTAPLSAIAARRAAMEAGLYKPAAEPEEEQGEVSEEEYEQNYEGIEVQSVTDEEDLREPFDEDLIKSPISGADTPNGTFTPLVPAVETKSKNKM
jgi:hypothetical protein